jgi:RNA polymerase sigma-70 factor (ECF subfamily)
MQSVAPIDEKEQKLIQFAQKGDRAALEALLLKYEKKVYNVAYRFMGCEADAYDMAQDSLIKIYKGVNAFRLEASFSSWVYRVTVNTCLDELRKRKKAPLSLDKTIESGLVIEDKSGITPEIHALNIESREDIQKAINTLSADHRITVVLRDIQGLSYEEIADTLSISIGTVKSRLNRGRQRLKEILIEK